MPRKFDISKLPDSPDLAFEQELWQKGFLYVAGIDEAGRGALAGPVFAAAVILPFAQPDLIQTLAGVDDSKKLTPSQREHWATHIPNIALSCEVASASAEEIDQIGILPATRLAAKRAVESLTVTPNHLLLDYIRLPVVNIPQTPLVKGDARSLSIAAASILAKTARDAHLLALDKQFPEYSFSAHKGYGTPEHLTALEKLGPTPIHRRTFSPLRPRLL
ncbi:MAG: ribonuclease HII [Anaerolineae bacterium]|nr:ribonuclease HII [Anaerolineae bacterium]